MPLSPAAIGIVYSPDRTQVLLVKRKDVPVWVLPGGGIEAQETAEEAVVREVLEETGLQIAIERKAAEYYPINRLAAFTTVFVCQSLQGKLLLSDETSAIAFHPLKQLPSSLFYLHKEWIDDAQKHKHVLSKPLTSVSYWNLVKYILKHPVHVFRYLCTRSKK